MYVFKKHKCGYLVLFTYTLYEVVLTVQH